MWWRYGGVPSMNYAAVNFNDSVTYDCVIGSPIFKCFRPL